MNKEEFTRLASDIRWISLNRGRLSDNEAEFIDDLLDQVAVYGRHMHVTDRQLNWMSSIMEKIDESRND